MCHNTVMKKVSKRVAPAGEGRRVQKRTAAEAFRDLQRQGYFARMGKTNTNIDQVISEGHDVTHRCVAIPL
jgi:hypothetical protein